jgi:hypothetical protein
MPSNGKIGYNLRHLPIVVEQIRNLAEQAEAKGSKPLLLAVLTEVLEILRVKPSTWGDPEYNLKKPGGCMYRGIADPVIVNYAVFEHEKIVLVTKVRWLPTAEGN